MHSVHGESTNLVCYFIVFCRKFSVFVMGHTQKVWGCLAGWVVWGAVGHAALGKQKMEVLLVITLNVLNS